MRGTKIQWVAAAVIILSVGGLLGTVLISSLRGGADSVDLSLPDSTGASSYSDGEEWPVEGGGQGELVELDRDNARTVIAMLARPEEYYISADATVYYGAASRTVTSQQWVTQSGTVTIRTDADGGVSYILRRDGSVTMWREGDSSAYTCAEGSFDSDDMAGIPTYEDALDETREILDAEYRDYNGELCVYIRVQAPGSDSSDDYYVSVKSGLLMRCESYSDSELVYLMTLSGWDIDVSGADSIQPPA